MHLYLANRPGRHFVPWRNAQAATYVGVTTSYFLQYLTVACRQVPSVAVYSTFFYLRLTVVYFFNLHLTAVPLRGQESRSSSIFLRVSLIYFSTLPFKVYYAFQVYFIYYVYFIFYYTIFSIHLFPKTSS